MVDPFDVVVESKAGDPFDYAGEGPRFRLCVPLGSWGLNGEPWQPSPILHMSADEQRRVNIANSYACP